MIIPFSVVALKTFRRRIIILLPNQRVGKALHVGELVGTIVRILVSFPVSEIAHKVRRRVANIEGHGLVEHLKSVDLGCLIPDVDGVRLGSEGHVDDRFGKDCVALRGSDIMGALIRGDGKLQRASVGHPDVFAREAHDAPRDVERILSRLEHPRKPIERGVRVGITHRLMQRRDQVVMLFPILVVEERLSRRALLDGFARDMSDALIVDVGVENRHFEGRERGTRVAVRRGGDHLDELRGHLDLLSSEPFRGRQRAVEEFEDLFGGKRVENENFASRQERAVDLERGVFRRGAYENDRALLDKGEKRVLLRLVEAMDFVDEEDRSLSERAVAIRLLHNGANLLDPARDGGEVDELRPRDLRDHVRQGRLPYAGRPPEDHRRDRVLLNHPSQDLPFPEESPLTDDFVERLRSKPRGEGLRRVVTEKRVLHRLNKTPNVIRTSNNSTYDNINEGKQKRRGEIKKGFFRKRILHKDKLRGEFSKYRERYRLKISLTIAIPVLVWKTISRPVRMKSTGRSSSYALTMKSASRRMR